MRPPPASGDCACHRTSDHVGQQPVPLSVRCGLLHRPGDGARDHLGDDADAGAAHADVVEEPAVEGGCGAVREVVGGGGARVGQGAGGGPSGWGDGAERGEGGTGGAGEAGGRVVGTTVIWGSRVVKR